MSIEVTMPQMGESVVEGTVTKWLVKEGDRVDEDQPLCEISTDKVDTEIPAPGAGAIAKLIAAEGQTIPVGGLLAIIEDQTKTTEIPAPSQTASPVAERSASTLSSKPLASSSGPPGRESSPAKSADVGSAAPAIVASAPAAVRWSYDGAARSATHDAADRPRRYSPVVMRMAEDQGIDLSLIPGTGIGGRVSKRDIERYMEALHKGDAQVTSSNAARTPSMAPAAVRSADPTQASGTFRPPVYQPREGDIVEPFTRRRKLIAEHMVYSKTHSPHVGTVAEVDLTKVMALRQAHNDAFLKREGFSLTLLPFTAMATVRALKEFPRMNASVAGEALVIRREINLGIAMEAEEGLVVPVIKGADTLTIVGLARETERLRRKLMGKALTADDLAGGSFTLTNPGREGNLYGFAIINQPQVGILRMGEVKKRPVVVDVNSTDAISIRTMMYLALSYDHRVIDGVLGNRFLYRTARILEAADFEL